MLQSLQLSIGSNVDPVWSNLAKQPNLNHLGKTNSDSSKQIATACYRCEDIKDYTSASTECSYVYCIKCVVTMNQESQFVNSCPTCTKLRCCLSQSKNNTRIHHCYKKCPSNTTTIDVRSRVMVEEAQSANSLTFSSSSDSVSSATSSNVSSKLAYIKSAINYDYDTGISLNGTSTDRKLHTNINHLKIYSF